MEQVAGSSFDGRQVGCDLHAVGRGLHQEFRGYVPPVRRWWMAHSSGAAEPCDTDVVCAGVVTHVVAHAGKARVAECGGPSVRHVVVGGGGHFRGQPVPVGACCGQVGERQVVRQLDGE